MGRLRALGITIGFIIFTLSLIPIQVLFLQISPFAARKFPQWYHAKVCKLLGLRIKITGELSTLSSLLIVSNHTSWLDIPILSSIAPLSFIAKEEVRSWPFISTLAKLQRTLFINRLRRTDTRKKNEEIFSRLYRGDIIVLFGEGTSSDGNRILPFKSSFFASVLPSNKFPSQKNLTKNSMSVQMVSIVYSSLYGVALGREDRSIVSWFGNKEFISHAWEVCKMGPLDVSIWISPSVALEEFHDRKILTEYCEHRVKKEVVRLLRGYSPDKAFEISKSPQRHIKALTPRQISKKWR